MSGDNAKKNCFVIYFKCTFQVDALLNGRQSFTWVLIRQTSDLKRNTQAALRGKGENDRHLRLSLLRRLDPLLFPV